MNFFYRDNGETRTRIRMVCNHPPFQFGYIVMWEFLLTNLETIIKYSVFRLDLLPIAVCVVSQGIEPRLFPL